MDKTPLPAWLPEILNVNGDPDIIRPMLYSIFSSEIKAGGLRYLGIPLFWNIGIRNDVKNPKFSFEEGFWHLIERKDPKTGIRGYDPRRAERLPWFNPLVKNAHQPEVTCFDYDEGRDIINTYIWLVEFDYIAILHKQKMKGYEVYFIKSAFHIDGPSSRRFIDSKFSKKLP